MWLQWEFFSLSFQGHDYVGHDDHLTKVFLSSRLFILFYSILHIGKWTSRECLDLLFYINLSI